MSTRRLSNHPKIDGWKGLIVASDECGYGSWAGPLVVCAASAPIGWDDPRMKDSKAFTSEAVRERLCDEILGDSRFLTSVVVIHAPDVDRLGVGPALRTAHKAALVQVAAKVTGRILGVVDGTLPVHTFGLDFDLVAIPKADQLVPECAVASIVGKTIHDRMMRELDKKHPGYFFSDNKGYGGGAAHPHTVALNRLGPCPEHRRSYSSVARVVEARKQPQNAWEALDDD